MAFNLASITNETRLRAPRVILLGVEKIGKSTFASQSDRPVFIPIRGEEGIDSIAVPQFPTCNSLSDVMSCLCSLYQEQHKHGTVCIDSISALEPLVWADTCQKNGNADSIEKVNGGYGKGYIEALKSWRVLTEALDALRNERNMASILIGHVKVKSFTDPINGTYDQWQFDINDKAASLLYRWADVVLFCNCKTIVKSEDAGFNKQTKRGMDISGGQRFLYTCKSPSFPAGGRGVYGRLPPEIPLSWYNFMDSVSAVRQKESA